MSVIRVASSGVPRSMDAAIAPSAPTGRQSCQMAPNFHPPPETPKRHMRAQGLFPRRHPRCWVSRTWRLAAGLPPRTHILSRPILSCAHPMARRPTGHADHPRAVCERQGLASARLARPQTAILRCRRNDRCRASRRPSISTTHAIGLAVCNVSRNAARPFSRFSSGVSGDSSTSSID